MHEFVYLSCNQISKWLSSVWYEQTECYCSPWTEHFIWTNMSAQIQSSFPITQVRLYIWNGGCCCIVFWHLVVFITLVNVSTVLELLSSSIWTLFVWDNVCVCVHILCVYCWRYTNCTISIQKYATHLDGMI